ncbi:MAG: ABC transporter permease [Kofleriaceae bacterium]|nr:ABC transporter permease [Kofleriaceae bacterium]MCL4226168.1 ABC transporter permease [Myxococcales bacterium]
MTAVRTWLLVRVTRVGAGAIAAVVAARDLWLVLVGTIAGIWRQYGRRGAPRPTDDLVEQLHVIGNRSLLFVAVTLGFIGMVMIYQACLQFSRSIGDLSQVGPQFVRLIVSDFGPTLTAMMLATRVGAGIAAEIGSMKVTEQVDALRLSGVLPVDYLLVPRFLASLVMTIVLSVIGSAIMYGAGAVTAYLSFGVNPRLFVDLGFVEPRHVILGLLKAAAYGAAIPVVAGFCGLRARGSSEGVGWATTAAVVGSSFAVIAIDFALSVGALWLLGGDL